MAVIPFRKGPDIANIVKGLGEYLREAWEGKAGYAIVGTARQVPIGQIAEGIISAHPRTFGILETFVGYGQDMDGLETKVSLIGVHHPGDVIVTIQECALAAVLEAEYEDNGRDRDFVAAAYLNDPVRGPLLALRYKEAYFSAITAGYKPFVLIQAEQEKKGSALKQGMHPYEVVAIFEEQALTSPREVPFVFMVRDAEKELLEGRIPGFIYQAACRIW